MTRPHLAAGFAFLVLAAFLGWEANRLNYYSSLGPGAGFFPVWLCLALGLLALSVFAAAARGRLAISDARFWPERPALLRILAVLAGLVFVIATLNILGFRITMAIFCVWTMFALGCRGVLQIATVALLGSIGCRALFVDVLGVALPSGVMGW
jgi:putative tricarboxylic transport membrane protein